MEDSLGNRETEPESIPHPPPETTPKALKDQMRVLFTNSRPLHVRQTMPQHHSSESEEDSRAVGEVRKHERVWDSAVLVQDDEIGDSVRAAGVRELFHDVVSSVDTGGVGET